jgi:hypothetical protein
LTTGSNASHASAAVAVRNVVLNTLEIPPRVKEVSMPSNIFSKNGVVAAATMALIHSTPANNESATKV